MKKKYLVIEKKSIIPDILVFGTFLLFMVGVARKGYGVLLIATLILWLSIFIKNLRRERVTVLAFAVTFFTFLLVKLILNFFDSTVELGFSMERTKIHTVVCLYISLIAFYFGEIIGRRVKRIGKGCGSAKIFEQSRMMRSSHFLYIATVSVSILLAVEKIFFVFVGRNYVSYYVSFSSIFPSFFSKIAEMSTFAFFVFLATLPSPKEYKRTFVIYLLVGVLGLLSGQRNKIILAIILVVVYFILYENYTNEPYSIVPRKFYFFVLLLFPFAMVFLEYFMYFRDGIAYSFNNVWASIKHMFSSLGGSVNVIGVGYELKEIFPKGHIYSLGGVVDFLTKNVFVRPILGTRIFHDNTIDMALYGNSYGQTITYLAWGETLYLMGRGMGSSYVAEAYHDFGYVGVIVFSGLYGYILARVNQLTTKSIMLNTVSLMMFFYIIYAPRDSAGAFLASFMNFLFIITYGLIVFLSKTIKTPRNRGDFM